MGATGGLPARVVCSPPTRYNRGLRLGREEREESALVVTIPDALEKAVEQKAAELQLPLGEVVRQALEWYLRMEGALLDELAAWQEVRDEAAQVAEGTAL